MYKILRYIFYRIKKENNNFIFFLERKLIVKIATRFNFFFELIEQSLINRKYVFLVNLSESVGHAMTELSIFDQKYLKKYHNKKIILIYKKSEIVKNIFKNYSSYLSQIKFIESNFLFTILLPLFYRSNKQLILDIGCGLQSYNLKNHQIIPNKNLNILHTGITIKSGDEFKKLISENIKINHNSSFFKKKNIDIEENFLDGINFKRKKSVLLHINLRSTNASAKPTEPKTYIKLIDYLNLKDYQIIFIGREKFPDIFKNKNIIEYGNSKFANFENDLKLFQFADYSIINASGLAALPRYLDKYYLYLNYWHLMSRYETNKCIMIPSLIKDNSGKFDIKKQMQTQEKTYYNFEKNLKLEKNYVNNLPFNSDTAINATSEDILIGFQELQDLKNKKYQLIKLQSHLQNLFSNHGGYISKNFLKKNEIIFKNDAL